MFIPRESLIQNNKKILYVWGLSEIYFASYNGFKKVSVTVEVTNLSAILLQVGPLVVQVTIPN